MVSTQDKSEIAFFDLETTFPTRPGQKRAILEFGSILVCPRTLVELREYSTLVQPSDISLISDRSNGISRQDVVSAPTFAQIADRVFDILDGRIWAGHNINGFDCPLLREAFQEINRPAPEPKGTIDTWVLLTEKFGRRAGDIKMASLATYFGLGEQSHRSLDDVRMNLDVLKSCATVLFLTVQHFWSLLQEVLKTSKTLINNFVMIYEDVTFELLDATKKRSLTPPDVLIIERGSIQPDDTIMGSSSESLNLSTANSFDAFRDCVDFLRPDEISVPSITVVLSPGFRGLHKLQILHNSALQVCCEHMKVRFGLSTKFVDSAGRPRLSFVLDASPDLCQVLDACDNRAYKMSFDSGSKSDWRPVVNRKAGFPAIRLQLPVVWDGNNGKLSTEIYQKESSSTQKVVFSKCEVAKLDALLAPGTFIDAYFSLDPYDFQPNAGISLVAKKLVIHSS